MILWTIQHKKVYEKLLENGVVRGTPMYIALEDFKEAYEWMAVQMRKRIGNPPEDAVYPMWAWYQWEGKRKRPDMRVHGRGWSEKGTPIVLLTLDVPDRCVLLSDFDYWHVVLNNGEIIFPYNEFKYYSKEEGEKSWENIFDISCSFDGEEHHFLSTQATMWEIKAEWVVKVEHFVSR